MFLGFQILRHFLKILGECSYFIEYPASTDIFIVICEICIVFLGPCLCTSVLVVSVWAYRYILWICIYINVTNMYNKVVQFLYMNIVVLSALLSCVVDPS